MSKEDKNFDSHYTEERQKAFEEWQSKTYTPEEIAWLNSDDIDVFIDSDEETGEILVEILGELSASLKQLKNDKI